ncbi:MAG: SDR family oxidoreductase [Bacteroidia bacterium]|nr:SDR family oxidoreductase [Bacteroidia bacterium]
MNKLIVVTGGTKGIGRAILVKFAAQGFDLITCARKKDDLDKLKIHFEKLGVKVYAEVADMADRNQVKNFTEFVNALKRPVDVLVNNAGIFVPGLVTEEPDGVLESLINSNVYSAYHTTRGIISQMKANKRGHIFNMCSIASIKAYPNGGSYAISKFALLGFSKVLREELMEHGIRVTAIMPGATYTSSWGSSDLPEDRFMKADDVADSVYAAYALSGRSVVEEMVIRPQLGDI